MFEALVGCGREVSWGTTLGVKERGLAVCLPRSLCLDGGGNFGGSGEIVIISQSYI